MGVGRNQYIDLMNQYRSKVHGPSHMISCFISQYVHIH